MVKNDKKTAVQTVLTLFLGAVIALVICILILLLCSAGVLWGWFKLDYGRQFGMIACALGGFAGAFFSVRRMKHGALPVGMGTGLLFAIMLILSCSFLLKNMAFGVDVLPAILACLCAGALAGFAGGKRKKRRLA